MPFLEHVSTAIDRAVVELVSQGRGIVSIEILKDERSASEYLGRCAEENAVTRYCPSNTKGDFRCGSRRNC